MPSWTTAGGQGDAAAPPAFSDAAGARPPRAGGPASPLAPRGSPPSPAVPTAATPAPRATRGPPDGEGRGWSDRSRVATGGDPAPEVRHPTFPPECASGPPAVGVGAAATAGTVGCRGGLKGSQGSPARGRGPPPAGQKRRARTAASPCPPAVVHDGARGRPRPHPTATPTRAPTAPRAAGNPAPKARKPAARRISGRNPRRPRAAEDPAERSGTMRKFTALAATMGGSTRGEQTA